MSLQVQSIIKIGKTTITNFSNLKIEQKIHDHHTFSVEIRQDLLVNELDSVMPFSQQLYGEKVSIEIKPISGIEDLLIIKDPKDYLFQFYGVVTQLKLQKSRTEDIEETIIVMGHSTSILLENESQCNSFKQMPLRDIVSKVKSGYNLDFDLQPFFHDNLAYTVQYNESDFKFLNRLAKRYGQWFYYNGRVFVFGSQGSLGANPHLVYGINMSDFKFKMKLVPCLFTIVENDNRKGSYTRDQTINYRKEVDGYHQNFINKSNAFFNTESVIQLNQNSAGGHAKSTAEEYAKNKMRSIISRMAQIKASSEVPGITLGNTVTIKGVDKHLETSYTVTQITHICDDSGTYENHFTAINFSGSVFSPQTNPDLVPFCISQTAVVTANADPDGLSAVQIQMPWQVLKGETTPYIPLLQNYGGSNRGSHIIPEIGDTVFVDFQGNNAELPIVLGIMTSDTQKSGYSTANNDIKALHTRSNNRLLMNDLEGSILLEDASKTFLKMDGNRGAEINTDVLKINVKKIIINATESTEIITNDYILNALSQIYVFSKTMSQKISGFMNLFRGSALINSGDKIDIEAKTAKLHGTQKALIHSDQEAVINSKGTAKMHGAQGNSLTNKAKTITASDADSISLAVVHFRPLESWRGEFGFDWLRENDTNVKPESDYKTIIESGYKDGINNLSKSEAYESLKSRYTRIPTALKKIEDGKEQTIEYFVPYLTLFSQEFVSSMPKTLLEPQYKAELNMFINIEENLEKFEFDYDDTLFKLTTRNSIETAKTNLKLSQCTITIECLKDLDKDHEITIYAYPKENSTVPKTAIEKITSRKLAGKIIVLKNDETIRKEEKIVLIEVSTNNLKTEKEKNKRKFNPMEEKNLYMSLHQALIIPSIEKTTFDLSTNSDFTDNGKHLKGKDLNYGYYEKGKLLVYQKPFTDCKDAFLSAKDQNGVFINEKYQNYFTVFKLDINANIEFVLGSVQKIGVKNVFVFSIAKYNMSTVAHEVMHGLGLWHTHVKNRPIEWSQIKYTFEEDKTTNIMSYSNESYSTWQWQWEILNTNIKLR